MQQGLKCVIEKSQGQTYALKRAAHHLEYVQTAAAVASNIFGIMERVRI